MAKRAKTSHEKRLLLQIAKAWSELAKTGTITPPLVPPKLKKPRGGVQINATTEFKARLQNTRWSVSEVWLCGCGFMESSEGSITGTPSAYAGKAARLRRAC